MRKTPVTALLGAGILMMQFGWVIAIPAFGGIDEIDHAYRAASVARGHWSPDIIANEKGPGDRIPVPSDIVRAAADRCSVLPETHCRARSTSPGDGEVLVASTATRYNPVYPWLVGTPALPFDGSAALYVMRAATVFLCDLLLFATWWLIRGTAKTAWPAISAALAVTPVTLYATANAAPNGVQMSAGLLMWSSGLAMSRTEPRSATIWCFTAASAVMVTVHSTGPMWALLVIATLVMWPGTVDSARRAWGVCRRTCASAIALTGIVITADVSWNLSHSTNLNWGDKSFPPLSASTLFYAFPLWVFQAIGSIPFRNQHVPNIVFATSLTLFGLMILGAFRSCSGRQRAIMVWISCVFFAVPAVLTVISFHSLGLAWQGRYALPFACGLPLVAGWILEDSERKSDLLRVLERVMPVGLCVVQSVAIWGVAARERLDWPVGHGLDAPPIWLLVCLSILASVLICTAFNRLMATESSPSASRAGLDPEVLSAP